MVFSEPKTPRSRRSIALDPATVAALKTHKAQQGEERILLGLGKARGDDQVFATAEGNPIQPQSVSQAFERLVKSAGVPRIRFHDLRHTYATLALASGMKPWDLSDRLGHSSVAFTLDVYRHALLSDQQDASDAAAAFILGERNIQ
ncbi:MAG: site-specific integrase [Actinomycetota bacterium]